MYDLEHIKLDGLESLLKDITGTSIKLKKISNECVSKENLLLIESEDVKSEAGVLSFLYSSLKIEVFSSAFYKDELKYWLRLYFSWTYAKTGGSNGSIIGDFLYDFRTEKWEAK